MLLTSEPLVKCQCYLSECKWNSSTYYRVCVEFIVQAVPVDEASTFRDVTIFRGVACSLKLSRLQNLAVNCTRFTKFSR